MIIQYLGKMINNQKANITNYNHLSRVWKIQLTMRINFISSLDPDNIEIMMGTETNDIIKELFESFLKRYQKSLKEKMKDSNFVFESADLLYYNLHKKTLKRDGSYVKSPEWLKNKGAKINPKSMNNKCMKYLIILKEYLIGRG